jgi:hypothetical protein
MGVCYTPFHIVAEELKNTEIYGIIVKRSVTEMKYSTYVEKIKNALLCVIVL